MGPDVNYQDTLHLHSLFGMLQEAASRNASEFGWGADVMDSRNACWLLLRMSVSMESLPSWGDTIQIETWSRGSQRLYFLRDFIVYNSDGETIGKATSMWIAADKESHRPIRPSMFEDISEKASDPRSVFVDMPPKIQPIFEPKAVNRECHASIVKYADYSDIDRNMHVNNTRYIAWSMDTVNAEKLENDEVLSVDINYLSEVKFGEKMMMYIHHDDIENSVQVDGIESVSGRYAFCCKMHKNVSKEI